MFFSYRLFHKLIGKRFVAFIFKTTALWELKKQKTKTKTKTAFKLNLISDKKNKEMDRKGMLRAVREKEVKDGQLPFKLRSDACTVV